MKKVLLMLGVLIILSSSVYALDCVVPTDGMVIIEDTTFCPGEYNLPNGVSIGADGVTLDCDGALLISREGINGGHYTNTMNDIIIENCNVQNSNWQYGISLYGNNGIIRNNTVVGTNGIGYFGYYGLITDNEVDTSVTGISLTTSYSRIEGNKIISHVGPGIWNCPGCAALRISDSKYTNITQNTINAIDTGFGNGINLYSYYNNLNIFGNVINVSGYSIHLSFTNCISRGNCYFLMNNKIWDNPLYGDIIDESNLDGSNFPFNNSFCVNCVGNNYFDGATGPTCPSSCDDSDNDGISDSEDQCPNTELPEIFPKLKKKYLADIDGDGIFETKEKKEIVDSEFSLEDTEGCSCTQILELSSEKEKKKLEKGCSRKIIEGFIDSLV